MLIKGLQSNNSRMCTWPSVLKWLHTHTSFLPSNEGVSYHLEIT